MKESFPPILLDRRSINKRSKTLSGLSSEVTVDANGNISFSGSANEIFVDPDRGDFRLRPGSPAIGMGASIPGITQDIVGNPRHPTHPSIGAYEYTGPPTDGPPVVFVPTPSLSPPSIPAQQPQTQPSVVPSQPSPVYQPTPIPTIVVQQRAPIPGGQSNLPFDPVTMFLIAGGAILLAIISD